MAHSQRISGASDIASGTAYSWLIHGIQHTHRYVRLTNGASYIMPTIPTAIYHRAMPTNEASNTAPRAAFQRPSFTAPTTPTADHHRQYKINNLRLI